MQGPIADTTKVETASDDETNPTHALIICTRTGRRDIGNEGIRGAGCYVRPDRFTSRMPDEVIGYWPTDEMLVQGDYEPDLAASSFPPFDWQAVADLTPCGLASSGDLLHKGLSLIADARAAAPFPMASAASMLVTFVDHAATSRGRKLSPLRGRAFNTQGFQIASTEAAWATIAI